ncbi:hypothetical protein Bca4012_089781 [Brassica carinata]|uniref:BnaC01g29990D protein n=4 Tax=Brassica TaxID=3705 RepID=A0A078GFT3_BRANA|nr:hypothetical protein HID58_043239 [Brassica napus]CAF2076245.1 unnamed protein product [Brassica napus]CDY25330.1 BnaC01g29990D [Brassica napus]VDD51476.1 unnamed protein product [Brassica oleracea]
MKMETNAIRVDRVKAITQDPPAGISGAPQDNNIMLCNAVIFGPDDSPWDGVKPLLCDPNPSSPANSEAARMFSESKREYNR